MKHLAHLTREEMVQSLDGELGATAQARVKTHLANCSECLARYEELAELSETLNHAVETVSVAAPAAARQRLEVALQQPAEIPPIRPVAWWKWAAVAAGLFLTLLLLRRTPSRQPETAPPETRALEPAARPAAHSAPAVIHSTTAHRPVRTRVRPTQLDGAFIRLPYSDPSLPVNASDIVRVEIRLSALANTGIVRTMPGSGDPLVEADVLLGLDGQPSAIRLVSGGGTAN